MSINAKGIQLFLWRIIKFSGSCCYKFVRKFPDISGFLIFVLCLYIFFPRVFLYFMYTSPIIASTAIYIRFYLKTKYAESKKDSGERLSGDGKIVNTSNGPSLRPQKSVRRNARKEVVEWDGRHSEEKDVLSLRTTYDSLSSKTNLLEENSKVSFDRIGSSSVEHEEGSPHDETGNDQVLDRNSVFDNETLKPHRVSDDSFQGSSGAGPGDGGGGGELEVKSLEEVDETGNNKAARDDKKNRMDTGLAAMERYKRLESLIAKRRAKKLFRMAIEKSLKGLHNVPPSQLGPILMAKINDGVSSNLDEEELQIPGSAPSFKQNSFDLPYGPQEEKPNLMADSFQQEFMPANQKEMLFSRHESFCRGPWFQLATTHNPNYADFNAYYDAEKKLVEGKPDKGGHHHLNSSGVENDVGLVEVEESNHKEAIHLSDEEKEEIIESSNNRIEIGEKMENTHDQEPGFDSGSEVRMETDSIKNNDSCYSTSSENPEPALDQTIKSPGICNDHVPRALTLAIPRKGRAMNKLSFDSSPSASERRSRTDFNSFYSAYRRPCLTPTYSIASDLQVEVSEVGSPPLAIDGTASSVDGDSVIYDGDVERDINSESEELWGGSFNLSREEASRERLRELDDIIEEEPVKVASTYPSEHEAKPNLNTPSSLSSRIDVTENCSSHPTYINSEIHQDSSDCKRGNLETSYEVKSSMKSGKRVGESQPSKYIEQDTRTLTELNARDAPNAVQSKSNLKSIPDITVDQNAAEDNILNRRLRDSIARAVNRRLMLEQFSISSSLSPRSVLPQNIPADQMPISEQRMQDLPRSVRENTVRNNLAYEQAHENLTSNMPQISHESVENSLDRTSDNCSLRELKALKKVIEKGNKNMNTSAVDEKEQGNKLTTNEDQSVFLIRPEDISGPGKSNEQEADMNKTEAIEPDYTIIVESAKERENSAAKVDRISKVDKSVADNKTNKEIKNDVLEREGALRILGKLKAVIEPSNTTGETSAGSIEDTEHEFKRLAEAEANAGLKTSAGETSSLNNIKNDEKMQNMTSQGVMDASQSGEFQEENLKVIESILNVDKIAGLSTSAGETNSLNNIKNDENMQNMTSQEGVDASQSGEVREDNLKVIESILNVDNIAKVLSINHEAVQASKPTESEVKADKLMKYDTGIDPSKSEKQKPKSDDTETMEPINSLKKVIKEGNNVKNINDLAANEKEREKLTTNEGEHRFSITQEGIVAPEKSNELELDLNKTESVESDYTSIVETAKERENSAAEVDRICKVNESASDNVINKETKSDVLKSEDALRILGKLEAVLESTNTTGESSLGSVEDTEHESKRLAEADANAGLSTSAGETNSLNDINTGEEIQNMTRQEGITDASLSGEDNLNAIDIISSVDNITKGTSIDRDIDVKASKPTESEFKAIKTDEKGSNAVAK